MDEANYEVWDVNDAADAAVHAYVKRWDSNYMC